MGSASSKSLGYGDIAENAGAKKRSSDNANKEVEPKAGRRQAKASTGTDREDREKKADKSEPRGTRRLQITPHAALPAAPGGRAARKTKVSAESAAAQTAAPAVCQRNARHRPAAGPRQVDPIPSSRPKKGNSTAPRHKKGNSTAPRHKKGNSTAPRQHVMSTPSRSSPRAPRATTRAKHPDGHAQGDGDEKHKSTKFQKPSADREKVEGRQVSKNASKTKVRSLAARAAVDSKEVPLPWQHNGQKDICKSLCKIIHKNLDTMLYGDSQKTDLQAIQQNPTELVGKASDMADLLEHDVVSCLQSVKKHILGDAAKGKSLPLVINAAILQVETDYEILQTRFNELRAQNERVENDNMRNQEELQGMHKSALQFKKECRKLQDESQEAKQALTVLTAEERRLKTSNSHLEQENARLKKELEKLAEDSATLRKDVAKSEELHVRLDSIVGQQAKEIRRLKDPDPEMVGKIRRLEVELTESKTANRRLELEKGLVHAEVQKLQAQHDIVQRERNLLAREKQRLFKENEALKTINRKLASI